MATMYKKTKQKQISLELLLAKSKLRLILPNLISPLLFVKLTILKMYLETIYVEFFADISMNCKLIKMVVPPWSLFHVLIPF